MELGIKGKTALVAASSKGLGKAAAFSLGREGANVVVSARNGETLAKTAQEIREKTGVEVLEVVADVSVPEQIDTLLAKAAERFGGIDILVNNAGGPPAGNFLSVTDASWQKAFELTMMSMVRMTRAVIPGMEKNGWGRIISIVSLSAKEPIDDLLVSSTIRPGILGLTKVLANQYGRSGITVNTVCPGYFRTARQEELGAVRSKEQGITVEEYFANSAKNIPAGRLGKPEELGETIAFLASQQAAFINGVNLLVDGGQTKGIH